MKILVFEYITSGGMLTESLPRALAAEGDLMLRTLAADLAAIDSVDVVVIRDARMPALDIGVQEIRLGAEDRLNDVWQRVLQKVDAVWPVAPETGGILERISNDILSAGKILLNSPPESVRLTASKSQTLSRLSVYGIPVVPTFTDFGTAPEDCGPWLVKPDDGVGCQGLRLFETLEQAEKEAAGGIIQPFLIGTHASLSLICHAGKAVLLSVNRQRIERHGASLTLQGCDVDAIPINRDGFEQLADQLAHAIPGLWGYVGVDFLICEEGIRILEVNPRLTTSYASLSGTLGINPAERVLGLLSGADKQEQTCAV